MTTDDDTSAVIAMGKSIRDVIDRPGVDVMLVLDEIADALAYDPLNRRWITGDALMLQAAIEGIRKATRENDK